MSRSAIGVKIKAKRKEQGLTQAALAQMAGVSASYLNLIENGKRAVGGGLLGRIAKALETDLDTLDDAEARRLTAALEEVGAEAVLQYARPQLTELTEFVGRHPSWARALLVIHRAYAERDREATALSDRLSQDPFLRDGLHRMISHVSAIRSASEILEDVDDLTGAELARFHRMIGQESGRLSELSRALDSFFRTAETTPGVMTPAEEVDDFIAAHSNYFPTLEAAAETFRNFAEASDGAVEGGVRRVLETRHGLAVIAVTPGAAAEAGLSPRGASLDRERGAVLFAAAAPPSRRRFELARVAVALEAEAEVDEIVQNDKRLRSAEARRRAREALFSYAAAAVLTPYKAFYTAAEDLSYDVEAIANLFSVSFEQAAHRLTTLRRPGAEGVPFGFMRVDPSGFVTKRFPLPGMPLPRLGGACPLWAVYRAFQTPDRLTAQLVEFPNSDRFLFIARTQAKTDAATGGARHSLSIQLACDAVHADRLAYWRSGGGAGVFDFRAAAPEPVGATCRLCARSDCPARQEDPAARGGVTEP